MPQVRQQVAVGFDLGTSTSIASWIDPSGQAHIASDLGGKQLIPSAILFGDDIYIGDQAIQRSEQSVENFAEGFKRDIGKCHYRKRVRFCDVPPEILTAMIVEYLATQVRREIGELSEIVVTVPAYFDEKQRTATQRAVTMAGLNVLDIINEPTAAAIAAGYETMKAGTVNGKTRILVYDLGGGTFDATLLEIDGRVFRTLGTDGDIYLGGRDFNERIVNIIADSFLTRHGLDPRCDTQNLFRLENLAEKVKCALTVQPEYQVSFQHSGMIDGMTLTRRQFEQSVEMLIERTVMTAQAVVHDAGLQWHDLDHVLLVGGSSRMPLVRKRLEAETGIPVILSADPDRIVAKGAALYAALRSQDQYLDADSRFEVVNVNAHSLGIQGIDLQTKQRINKVIIPRNTPLPASATYLFTTTEDGQKNARVRLLEGESENPEFCSTLGQCVVRLDEFLPKGTAIRVNCCYDANGTISFAAHVPATKVSASVELRRDSFAELEPLDVWRQRLSTGNVKHQPDLPREVLTPHAELSPSANTQQLIRRLDQICVEVGQRLADSAVPVRAVPAQRLLKQTRTEHEALRRLVEVINKKQQAETIPCERMQLQGQLARVRMAFDQSQKLYQHSCLVLGRVSLDERGADSLLADEKAEAVRLRQWIDASISISKL